MAKPNSEIQKNYAFTKKKSLVGFTPGNTKSANPSKVFFSKMRVKFLLNVLQLMLPNIIPYKMMTNFIISYIIIRSDLIT